MATSLADAHILAQARLRAIIAAAVAAIWKGLPGYDRADVPEWLAAVVPLVEAGQRKSVALTDAYLARALDRQPLGLDASKLIGAAVRNGTPPATVYTRPFIQTWGALSREVPWEDAVAGGLHRATSSAEMDVQLSHFAAYEAAGSADRSIRAWRRVADGGACEFCRTVNGAIVKSPSASPLHNHCGCGLEPLLDDHAVTPLPAGVAVHEHGELGPVLGDPTQHFTSEADFA